jgi:hypothetical protein
MRPSKVLLAAAAAVLGSMGRSASATDAADGADAMAAAVAAHRQGLSAAFQYCRPEQKWAPGGIPEHEASGYLGDVPAMFLEVQEQAGSSSGKVQHEAAVENTAAALQASEAALLVDNSLSSRGGLSMRRGARASGGRILEMVPPVPGAPDTPGGGTGTKAQQQLDDMLADASDGKNPAAEHVIADPDSLASVFSTRTKKVPHSWFGKGLFLAPTYQIATGREECNVCKALIQHWYVRARAGRPPRVAAAAAMMVVVVVLARSVFVPYEHRACVG